MKTNLKVKTSIKAGDPGIRWNHNATQTESLKVKSSVKAGGVFKATDVTLKRGICNHNTTQLRSLNVKSGIKAGDEGFWINNHNATQLRSLNVNCDDGSERF